VAPTLQPMEPYWHWNSYLQGKGSQDQDAVTAEELKHMPIDVHARTEEQGRSDGWRYGRLSENAWSEAAALTRSR